MLVNGPLEASIPGSPSLAPQPGGVPGVIQAVAEAPADAHQNPNEPQEQEPQFGDAYWVRITTLYGAVDAVLDDLQKANVKNSPAHKTISWKLLQRPPGVGPNAGKAEREDNVDDVIRNNNVQVTNQYEYFKYSGLYDSETHEAVCDSFYATQAAALAGGPTVQIDCQNANGNDMPYVRPYWVIDPVTNLPVQVPKGNRGAYVSAHINAYNYK